MKHKKWLPALILPVLLGASACTPPGSVQACSEGRCVTVRPGGSQTAAPPAPAVTKTCPDPDRDSDCDHKDEHGGQ